MALINFHYDDRPKSISALGLMILLTLAGCGQGFASTECPAQLLNKKIAVVVGSILAQTIPTGNSSDLYDQVRNLFEGKLLALSFEPIDQMLLQSQLPEKQKQLLLVGDVVGAAKLGKQLGAELLLLTALDVQSRNLTSFNTNMVTVSVQLSLKLVDIDSSQIISSTSLMGKTAGLDATAAVMKLLSKKADPLIDDLYRQYCAKASLMEEKSPAKGGVNASAAPPQKAEGAGELPEEEQSLQKTPAAGNSVSDL